MGKKINWVITKSNYGFKFAGIVCFFSEIGYNKKSTRYLLQLHLYYKGAKMLSFLFGQWFSFTKVNFQLVRAI